MALGMESSVGSKIGACRLPSRPARLSLRVNAVAPPSSSRGVVFSSACLRFEGCFGVFLLKSRNMTSQSILFVGSGGAIALAALLQAAPAFAEEVAATSDVDTVADQIIAAIKVCYYQLCVACALPVCSCVYCSLPFLSFHDTGSYPWKP